MRVEVERQRLHLSRPLKTAHGTVEARDSLILSIDDGSNVGWGEAAPLPTYDGGSLEACSTALDEIAAGLGSIDPDAPARSLAGLPEGVPSQVRAAVDVAVHDLAARRAGIPLWKYLGGESSAPIECSRLIQSTQSDAALVELQQAADEGFTTIKLKAGFTGDIDFLHRVIPAATANGFRSVTVDANGRWSVSDATRAMEALEPLGTLNLEQPVPGLAEMRQLMAADRAATLILDESATDNHGLEMPPAGHACALKLQAWGGCTRLLEAARTARSSGIEILIGSTLEGPIGIAASLHCAATIAPELPCGLATLDAFVETASLGWTSDGFVTVPSTKGLGIDPSGLPV